jgi:uncharacterized protein YlxW (UPF0749 family)
VIGVRVLGLDRIVYGLGVDTTVGGSSPPSANGWQFPRFPWLRSPSQPSTEVKLSGIWTLLATQRRSIGLAVLSVVLGVLVIAEWQSRVDTPAVTASPHAVTGQTIDRLEQEQAGLKKQIAGLRTDLTSLQQRAAANQTSASSLNRDLGRQRAIAGTAPLAAQGIEILLDDSTATTLLPGENADNYIVHEYQIRDIVNLLWLSGATGVAINGERFVNSTSVYCVGSTILINDTRTSPPYRIDAVGSVQAMREAFDDGNALKDLKGRVQAYGLVLRIEKDGPITLPGFDGGIAMKHAAVALEGVNQ